MNSFVHGIDYFPQNEMAATHSASLRHNIKESIRDTLISSNCDVNTGCSYNYNKWNFPKTIIIWNE